MRAGGREGPQAGGTHQREFREAMQEAHSLNSISDLFALEKNPDAVEILDIKPTRKGALRAIVSVLMPGGWIIADCPVCTSHGKTWASLPSKPLLDPEGRHRVDARGKPLYVPILRWTDRATADEWSQAVIAQVKAMRPQIFDDGVEILIATIGAGSRPWSARRNSVGRAAQQPRPRPVLHECDAEHLARSARG